MNAIVYQLKWSLAAAITLLSTCLFAQEHSSDSHESHNEAHGAHFHANHTAIFLGVTAQPKRDNTHFSPGIDYIRSFPPHGDWGVGIFFEVIFAEHTEWVFGVPLFYQAQKNFWLRTGPGIEIFRGDIADLHVNEAGETEPKVKFLYRIGAGYDFHAGNLTISPSLDLDLVRSAPALVFGINIGKGF